MSGVSSCHRTDIGLPLTEWNQGSETYYYDETEFGSPLQMQLNKVAIGHEVVWTDLLTVEYLDTPHARELCTFSAISYGDSISRVDPLIH
jgi:hypothetical protein